MNRVSTLIFILCAAILGIVGMSLNCCHRPTKTPEVSPWSTTPVVITKLCTIKVSVSEPVITSSRVERRRLPVAPMDSSELQKLTDYTDSVTVLDKVESSMYEGDSYRAWVSGIDASLDSIVVFGRRDSVFVPFTPLYKQTPKRWHIGPYVGLGWTHEGIRPSIGVCVSFSIFDL